MVREEAAKKAWKAAHRRWFQLQDAGTWPVIRAPIHPFPPAALSAHAPAALSAPAPAATHVARAQAAQRLRQKHSAAQAALAARTRPVHAKSALEAARGGAAAAKGGAAAARRGAAMARLEEAHARLAATGGGAADREMA